MKVYIAGSITNNPNYIEDFKKAEEFLISEGHAVINPVKNLGFERKDYIDMGLNELMHCDAIYMLNGWLDSAGAMLELNYAQTVELVVLYKDKYHEDISNA